MIFGPASQRQGITPSRKDAKKLREIRDIFRGYLDQDCGFRWVTGGFEVASVKPSTSNTRPTWYGGSGTPDPGQVHYHDVPMAELLREAYDVDKFRLSGPNWIESERYSVDAKVPAGATKEQFRDEWSEAERTGAGRGGLARDQDLSGLLRNLQVMLRSPVIDETGLKGKYDFSLTFSPPSLSAVPPAGGDNIDRTPDLFVALQEPMGLKLESRKVQLDVVVVDRLERVPSET
jgi:hypothetical protein